MLVTFFSFMFLFLFSQVALSTEINLVHGDGDSLKVDLIVIGDGYSLQDQDHYHQRVDELVDYMFTSAKSAPYPRYQNFINVWRIDLMSRESGIDDIDAGIYKDTPLHGHKGCIDYTIAKCQVDWNVTHDSIAAITQRNGIQADWYLVFLNTDDGTAAAHYASGGMLPVIGTRVFDWYSRHLDIVLHEGGHAWHRLADEYHYNDGKAFSGSEPSEINVTLQSDGARWVDWLGYQAKDMSPIGAYEGSKYAQYGIWDPTQGSKMDGGGPYDCHNMNNDCGHHAIAIEKIIQDIHSMVPQVLSGPTRSSQVNNTVSLHLVDESVSLIQWYLDGELQPQTGSTFEPIDLTSGHYDLQAIVYDEVLDHAFSDNAHPHPLDLVRRGNEQMSDTLNWDLLVTGDLVNLISLNESHPTQLLDIHVGVNDLRVSSPLIESGRTQLTIFNIQGEQVQSVTQINKLSKESSSNPSASIHLDISSLSQGVYFVNLHSDKGSFSQRFFK